MKPISAPAPAGLIIVNCFLLALVEAVVFFLVPEAPPAGMSGIMAGVWFKPVLMAAMAALFLAGTLAQWLTCRRSLSRTVAAAEKTAAEKPPPETDQGPSAREKRRHHNKKLYLHLLSVLQAEGRLLDFLNEDLQAFEDSQIGAAARGVHDNCRQALARYVTLGPVIEEAEGQAVTIDPRSDPDRFQLSGNVTGDPPFQGVVTHPGWRAGTLNLPEFSFSGDPEIIAPAGVKIT
ncbi:MAG: DUF2760 domain-containing protein [Desulfosudaceae bacterium]